jgi:serine/threonine-protein kinase
MSREEQLAELMLQWEERRLAGIATSAGELCEGCPELTTELARRIDIIESMESLLSVEQVRSISNATTAPRAGGPPAPQPTSIPGYEILDVLDQGGMGIVYRARQVALSRIVAVKMMAGAHPLGPRLSRFRTECRAIAQLHHPNLVEIFEFGETDVGPYFSMELVEGGNLNERLKSDPPGFEETATLVESIARVVHEVHERGIIHRDLKPANILLTPGGVPKVTDFGLAKLLDEESGHSRTGEVLGTLTYMAPEQIDPSLGSVDAPADVYALGAILYELLTGQPPFRAMTTHLMRQIVQDDPPAPSTIRSDVPRDLAAICLKCLEKKPESRYASALDLAEDLRGYIEHRPIKARPAGPIRRTVKVVRRRPELRALVVLALFALVAVPVAILIQGKLDEAQLRADAEEVAPLARDVLRRNCFACHGGEQSEGTRALDMLSHAALLDSDRRIIVPGSPEDSRLIQRISDGSMPPAELEIERPPLPEEELSILRRWIRGGAPSFASADFESSSEIVVERSESAAAAKAIFVRHCYECHNHDLVKGGIRILHHRLLVNVRKVVVPGKPDESELLQLLMMDSEGVMPPAPRPRLSKDEVSAIRRWIAEGARPFPAE